MSSSRPPMSRRSKTPPTLRLTRDGETTPRVEVTTALRETVGAAPARRGSGPSKARMRLVAGTVDLPATPDEDSSGIGAVIGRIGPDEFLRGLESTLERMQSKLDALKRDVEEEGTFKFPVAFARGDDNGPRPRAA